MAHTESCPCLENSGVLSWDPVTCQGLHTHQHRELRICFLVCKFPWEMEFFWTNIYFRMGHVGTAAWLYNMAVHWADFYWRKVMDIVRKKIKYDYQNSYALKREIAWHGKCCGAADFSAWWWPQPWAEAQTLFKGECPFSQWLWLQSAPWQWQLWFAPLAGCSKGTSSLFQPLALAPWISSHRPTTIIGTSIRFHRSCAAPILSPIAPKIGVLWSKSQGLMTKKVWLFF